MVLMAVLGGNKNLVGEALLRGEGIFAGGGDELKNCSFRKYRPVM